MLNTSRPDGAAAFHARAAAYAICNGEPGSVPQKYMEDIAKTLTPFFSENPHDVRIHEALGRVARAAGYERVWVTPTGEAHLFLERAHPTKSGFIQVAHLERLVDDRARLPEVVCLCGSTRFMEAFQKANLDLTLAGKIVLSIGCNTKSDVGLQITDEQKVALDELHKRTIDLCDKVLVLNVDGYIGSSTRSEIEYAERIGREVQYLEPVQVRPVP